MDTLVCVTTLSPYVCLSAERSSRLDVHVVASVRVSAVVDYLQLPSLAIVTVPLIIIDNSDQSKR